MRDLDSFWGYRVPGLRVKGSEFSDLSHNGFRPTSSFVALTRHLALTLTVASAQNP